MPSNYEKICQDNLRRRGDEFDDLGRLLAEQLYSDKSHFVYELLQNAEDALGRLIRSKPNGSFRRSVKFRLYRDKLVFGHFGIPFSEEDVKGISDVLSGTKVDDKLQIGRFGIGFKSVYAFTASPEIHSGDEHFVIKRYIRPEAKAPDHWLSIEPDETVFVFPFDHESLTENQAFDLILNKLKGLGPRILLFLRSIDEIEWSVDSVSESGQYLKEVKRNNRYETASYVTVIGQGNGHEDDERWLVFERPVIVSDQYGCVYVEVGYRLHIDDSGNPESIEKENNTQLVVYFPTEKETKMGVMLQGPFHTTSARENILHDDNWNSRLIAEIAELVVDSVRLLKDMGLLSISALEALPIRVEENWYYDDHTKTAQEIFYGNFYNIFSSVRNAFVAEDLLPTTDIRTFVSARKAKLARPVDLVNILNRKQLGAILQSDSEIKWLSTAITESSPLWLYLTRELGVEVVTPETLAQNITESFLVGQDDDWFVRFYEFLSGREALWRSPRWSGDTGGILLNKPILRLQNGKHVKPFRHDGNPNAYLADGTDTLSTLPVVKTVLSQHDGARRFLEKLGIMEIDVVEEVVNSILPKYQNDVVNIEPDDNARDLRQIGRAYETDSREKKERLRKELCKSRFILADLPNKGEKAFRSPEKVYFASDELEFYFSGNSSFSFVYSDNPHAQMLKDLGVADHIRITCNSRPGSTDPVNLGYDREYKRGLQGFDPNIEVDGLEKALATPSVQKSQVIWNRIACNYWHCIRGKVVTSSRRDFSPDASTYNEKKVTSLFGELLIGNAWIPDSNGNMCRPDELSLNDLHKTLDRNERLAIQLGMRMPVDEELVKKANISKNTLKLARQIEHAPPEDQKRINDILLKSQSQFPQRGSADSERRASRIAAEYQNAPVKVYETRDSSVRTSRGEIDSSTYLRNQYTNEDNQMICQICEKEMPFKKRDGDYYFEAVEALTKSYISKEHTAQFLALCPLCSAMYRELVKLDESTMQELFLAMKESTVPTIPLMLGERNTSIRFVETHWLEMKAILKSVE